jgi:outer membrane protein
MKFKGTSIRSAEFKFGDNTFNASVPFTSTLKLDHYDAALFYGVPFLKTATANVLNVEFGLNLRVIDFKAEITQPQTSLSQSKSLTVPVPMGYFGFQIAPIDLIKIEGELRGIAYSKSRFYDAIGRVKVRPLPLLFLSGGYKFQNIHMDQSNVVSDLRFGGPVFEVGLEY